MDNNSKAIPDEGLAATNERLRTALEAAGVGTWDFDIRRKLVQWDERTRELYGYTQPQITSYDQFLQCIHPDDRGQVSEAVTWALNPASGGHYDMEFRTVGTEDSQLRWLRSKGKAYFDEQGKAYRFSGIAQDITEDVSLRKEQQKLLTLVENSVDLMSILELDGRNSYLNKAGKELLGFESDRQVQQTPVSALHAPDDLMQVDQEVLPSVLNTGKWSGIMQVRHLKTGEIFPVTNDSIRIDDPQTGQPLAIGAVMRDLRPEMIVRQALLASEERFRNIILQAPIATAIYVGRDMIIQLANEAMLNVWGKDASVIGKKLRDALPELEGQPFHQLLDDVFTSGVAYQGVEDRADLYVDGQLQSFYFNFTYKPLLDNTGAVYAILNMALDITYQVNAKRELKQIQENLREAIELAQLGTWTIDLRAGTVLCSDRVREWLGIPDETITLEDVARSFHKRDRLRTNQLIQEAFHTPNNGILDMEYTIVNRQTGQERVLHTQARTFFDEAGEAWLVRGTSQDITAQRVAKQELEHQVQLRTEQLQKTNAQLRQSNEELEQYAYVASHDLQEPLRKIRIFSEMLAQLDTMPPTAGTTLNKVISSAERMSLLIKDLLQYSRLLKAEKKTISTDLAEVLQKVVIDFELIIEEKQVQLTLHDLPIIEAIPLQMNQLFYNLISNALKFTREGVPPHLTIQATTLAPAEREQYQLPQSEPNRIFYDITVSDNGIGFEETFAEHIFEPFKRLHNRQHYPGSGIGLALCRKIVHNHQGIIFARSKLDQGTVFHLILPDRQLPDDVPSAPPPA